MFHEIYLFRVLLLINTLNNVNRLNWCIHYYIIKIN